MKEYEVVITRRYRIRVGGEEPFDIHDALDLTKSAPNEKFTVTEHIEINEAIPRINNDGDPFGS